jgi:hypothetical protein
LKLVTYLKRIANRTNGVFIQVVLFFFYFIGIGLGAFIYFLFKKEKKTSSYWQEVTKEKIDLSSPY